MAPLRSSAGSGLRRGRELRVENCELGGGGELSVVSCRPSVFGGGCSTVRLFGGRPRELTAHHDGLPPNSPTDQQSNSPERPPAVLASNCLRG
jgi:hypothetical protein